VSAEALPRADVDPETWWVAHLDGVPIALDIPTSDLTDPPGTDVAEIRAAFELPPDTGADGARLLERGVLSLIARYGATGRVAVTMPVAGEWLPVVVDLDPEPNSVELSQRLDDARQQAAERSISLETIVAALTDAKQPVAPITRVAVATGDLPWPLEQTPELMVRFVNGELEIRGRGAVFHHDALARIDRHLRRLISCAATAPDAQLSALEMLDAAEKTDLQALGRSNEAFPQQSLHELIGATAAGYPDATAVSDANIFLTYRELDERANALAHRLIAHNVGRGSLVGVCTNRSADMVISLLGIMKTGAAYVPIDPGYPAERISMMLEDAGLAAIVTQHSLAGTMPPSKSVEIFVDDDEQRRADAPTSGSSPNDPAYVIFTSGSTGRPKGVVVPHRALVNFLASMAIEPGLQPTDKLLAVTTLSFDIAGLELYLPLFVGATVVVAESHVTVDPDALGGLLDSAGITVMQATPATWQMLVDAGWQGKRDLRALCGGEALPRVLADGLTERVEAAWNLYGPTETTIWSLLSRLRVGEKVTIGGPIANTQVYVRGPRGELLPGGLAGELAIGGAGLALGYLGRDDLTAERFIPDPFGEPDSRIYLTGDLVRLLPSGAVEYLGRIDNQVKIRGFRIELGDVESALDSHSAVARSVAVAQREDDGRPQRLVAYATLNPGPRIDGIDLRSYLHSRLPDYMIPSVVTVLDSFPLTPNGKVDRRLLPKASLTHGGHDRQAATTPTEHKIILRWQSELRTAEFGVTDNIFDLGADSLMVARVYARVAHDLDVRLPLAPAFEAPTVRELALLVDRLQVAAPLSSTFTALAPISPSGSRTPLFLVHGGAGTILLFQPLAQRLGPDQPVYGLQAVGLYGHDTPQQSVPAMAERYIAEIRVLQPHGPYRIGGYCFGALVAYEMARQLALIGETTDVLLSFNGPSPSYLKTYRPLFDAEGAVTDENGKRIQRTPVQAPTLPSLPTFLDPLRPVVGKLVYGSRGRVRRAVRTARFEWYLRRGKPLPASLREASGFQRLAASAQDRYDPPGYAGTMSVVKGAGLYHRDDLGWSDHVRGGVEVFEVPGAHSTPRRSMGQALVAPIADFVQHQLDAADAHRQ
jgi:amino acid adenylation domain-containing protein